MNERLRELRKALRLTQQEFANAIGTTQNNIANYEGGRRNPSGAVINNICKEFSVNESWLRTGEGEMFVQISRDEEIAEFVGKTLSTEGDTFKKRLISVLAKLNTEEWELIEQMALKMAETKKED